MSWLPRAAPSWSSGPWPAPRCHSAPPRMARVTKRLAERAASSGSSPRARFGRDRRREGAPGAVHVRRCRSTVPCSKGHRVPVEGDVDGLGVASAAPLYDHELWAESCAARGPPPPSLRGPRPRARSKEPPRAGSASRRRHRRTGAVGAGDVVTGEHGLAARCHEHRVDHEGREPPGLAAGRE